MSHIDLVPQNTLIPLKSCTTTRPVLHFGCSLSDLLSMSNVYTVPSPAEAKLNSRQKLNQLLFSKIKQDLAPWQDRGITIQQVERTYCTLFEGGFVDGGFRVQVRFVTSKVYSVQEKATLQ